MNHVPCNYTSMEVLAQAEHENPNPTPVLAELFKRAREELSESPPVDSAGNRFRKIVRARAL